MPDQPKTHQELSTGNAALKERIRELEAMVAESRRTENSLRRSQQLFSIIFRANPAAVVLSFFSNGKCVDVNEAYVRLTGYERKELIGKTTVELNIWTSSEERQRVVAELAEKGRLENVELTLRRKNGELIKTIAGGEVITLDGQRYILFFFLDVTDRKRSEEALRESEEKYRVLVEAAGEAIFIAQDGIIKFCNKNFSDIAGYDLAYLINMPFNDLVHPDDRQMVFDRYIQRLEGKDVPSRYRFRFIDAWGNTRWADMSVALISWGGKLASLCLASDITELKQTEEALKKSEEKYRHLFESAMEGILVTRGETLQFVNPALERILGYPLEKITSEPFINFIHPDDQAMVVDHHLRRMRGEPVETGYDFRIIDSEGAVKWLTINSQVIEWEGAPANLSFIADITERKRAEEARFDALARFSGFADASQYGMGMADLDGRITFANATLARMLGEKTAKDCLGKHFPTAYYSPSMTQKLQEEVLPSLMSVGYWQGELELQTVDGRNVPTEENYFVIRDEQGRIRNLAATLTDITYRKHAEEEREKLQAHLARAQKLESIGTLAGGIAHDFNNLLMGIQGYASLTLLDLDPSHPHYERIKRIEEQVQSGSYLTKQLLGFARGGRYEVKPTDMNDIIQKTSSMFGRTKKEIAIHQKHAKTLWPVEVDQGQMEQVFMNLYVNAWQAMPDGGEIYLETKNVLLDDEQAISNAINPGKYVRITVTDTGIGMDAQTRERVFDPFFTTKKMGRGTGLGLATVYGIIKGHKGTINVDSEPGHGTTFSIFFPASEKEVVQKKTVTETISRGTETILVVDDEKIVVAVTREMLESLGYRVYEAGNGQEAIAVYMEKRTEIALVILDMIMPGISGSETYDRLKEINSDILVLLSSGYSIDGEAQAIISRGCNGFLQKPFQLKYLSRKVREVLDG